MLMCGCSRDLDANMPKVSTNGIISLTETSFECGGTVISDGGNDVIRRGICWSATEEPTASGVNRTEDGVGLGTYRSKISGLTPENVATSSRKSSTSPTCASTITSVAGA